MWVYPSPNRVIAISSSSVPDYLLKFLCSWLFFCSHNGYSRLSAAVDVHKQHSIGIHSLVSSEAAAIQKKQSIKTLDWHTEYIISAPICDFTNWIGAREGGKNKKGQYSQLMCLEIKKKIKILKKRSAYYFEYQLINTIRACLGARELMRLESLVI